MKNQFKNSLEKRPQENHEFALINFTLKKKKSWGNSSRYLCNHFSFMPVLIYKNYKYFTATQTTANTVLTRGSTGRNNRETWVTLSLIELLLSRAVRSPRIHTVTTVCSGTHTVVERRQVSAHRAGETFQYLLSRDIIVSPAKKKSDIHIVIGGRSSIHIVAGKRSTMHITTGGRSTIHTVTGGRSTIHIVTERRSTTHSVGRYSNIHTVTGICLSIHSSGEMLQHPWWWTDALERTEETKRCSNIQTGSCLSPHTDSRKIRSSSHGERWEPLLSTQGRGYASIPPPQMTGVSSNTHMTEEIRQSP